MNKKQSKDEIKAASKKKAAGKKRGAKKKVAKKTTTKKRSSKKASTKKSVSKKTATAHPQISPRERYEMIATMAYYRAEQRSFSPGQDQQDWYECEQIIDRMLSSQQ